MIKLTKIYNLNEHLENVSNDKNFFWVAQHGGKDFKPGEVVPKFQGVKQLPELEDQFEKVRREKYPDKPSRINNNFIFRNIHEAAVWAKDYLGGANRRIYQVVVSGKCFYADLGFWTMAGEEITSKQPGYEKELMKTIDAYWKGVDEKLAQRTKRGFSSSPEVIVDGTVKIVKEIKPDKVEKLYQNRHDFDPGY